MNDPPHILIVDDNETNRDILEARLKAHGYVSSQAADGEEALAAARQLRPDLILLDVMMPKLDGIEVCRRIKGDATLPFMPVILVTSKSDTRDVIAGLDAGADEYLTKPIDQGALVARVKSALRIKALHDQVQAQAADVAAWNRTLEERVAAQVVEIERVGRLRRFLSPQVAQFVVSSGDDRLLEFHRRDITVVFCDLRGFTAFSETAEPEEVMGILREYHAALGLLINMFEGTIERFTGDGVMVLFNDPLPCPDPCGRAVRMAVEMRDCIGDLTAKWRLLGHELGFGIGIAHGFATLGCVGFEGRVQYSATGTVANLAARLCDQAASGQILIDPKVHHAVGSIVDLEPAGELVLKGLRRPVRAFNVCALRSQRRKAARRPAGLGADARCAG
ncbi:MAG TPA: response regulator [Xanthobacteraceae bacterium]|nr:response regulator [Xanthobacteraceae bacterium]